MTSVEQIEAGINKLLQSNIVFALEHKIVKKGKLILFCIKDFFCIFTLICEEKNNKKIIYEIPYPFALSVLKNKVIFDYTVNTFCEKNKQVADIIKTLGIEKTSKLYNKRLTITAV